ncbi:MAG: antibiotic biosynthesis monooxygenase family protein [Nitriliruptoraceae bacterium]
MVRASTIASQHDARPSGAPTAGHVAVRRFEVHEGWEQAVVDACRNRPGLVDDVDGFLRLDVVRPREHPQEFWLLTYWVSEAAFQDWHRGHGRVAGHAGIPAGLKLVPGSARVDAFDHVTS